MSSASAALRKSEFTDTLLKAEAQSSKEYSQLKSNVSEIEMHDKSIRELSAKIKSDYHALENAKKTAAAQHASALSDLQNTKRSKNSFYELEAKRSKDYEKSLSQLEVNMIELLGCSENLYSNVDTLQEKFNELIESNRHRKQHLINLEDVVIERVASINSLEEEQKNTASASTKNSTLLLSAIRETESLKKDNAESHAQRESYQQSLKASKEKVIALEAANTAEKSAIAEARSHLDSKLAELASKHESIKVEASRLTCNIEEKKAELSKVLDEINACRKTKKSQDMKLSNLKQESSSKQQQLNTLEVELKRLQNECSDSGVTWSSDTPVTTNKEGHSAPIDKPVDIKIEAQRIGTETTCAVIRKMLQDRKLDTKGKKSVILTRLNRALVSEASAYQIVIRPASFAKTSLASLVDHSAHRACESSISSLQNVISHIHAQTDFLNTKIKRFERQEAEACAVDDLPTKRQTQIATLRSYKDTEASLEDIPTFTPPLPEFVSECQTLIKMRQAKEKEIQTLQETQRLTRVKHRVQSKIKKCRESFQEAQKSK